MLCFREMLGMDVKAAFPIMMGSCAFLMPMASSRFIRSRRYDPRAALSLLLGGLPAVFIAAYIFKTLPMTIVRPAVIIVVVYTAIGLVRTAMKNEAPAPA